MSKKTEYTRQIGQKNVFTAPVGGYSDHYRTLKNIEEPPEGARLVWSDKENRMVWENGKSTKRGE